MEELLKSLSKVLQTHQDSPELNEAAALTAWKHAIGDGLRQHTRALRLEGKTLIVAVRDAIWQKQLDTMKSQLLFRVNSILGRPLLNNIAIVVAGSTGVPAWTVDSKYSVVERAGEDVCAPSNDAVDNEISIELWSAANAISDKQLRQKFLKAATGMLKRKEK